ncbi:Osmotic growth protein 1 [Allomyces arbusculus]|nr:Osmotic growth protein 1 [Allomyces arbusculus]
MSTTRSADVIVIGGGLAGLSAALEAAQHGASRVLLIDKSPRIGGNSAKATSGINGANTRAQAVQHLADSPSLFANDTLRSGQGRSDPALVDVLANESAAAVAFVEAEARVALDVVVQAGGHSAARTHREAPRADGMPAPVGWDIVQGLAKRVAEMDVMEVVTGATVTTLERDDDGGFRVRMVVKAKADGHQPDVRKIKSRTVVLATGGFSANAALLAKYAPHLPAQLPTTNGDWAQGEGLALAQSLGATLIDLDQVQLHPTAFVDPADPTARTKFLAPEALRGHGSILLQNGRRFTNELGTRAQIVAAMAGQPALLVANDAVVANFDPAVIKFYGKRGLMRDGVVGVDALADLMRTGLGSCVAPDVTAEELKAELDAYTAAAKGEKPDAFGKTVFPAVFRTTDTFAVACVTPAVHYTMGGVRIDKDARVVRNGGVVPGLFAAGEVSGGVHGANRLAGNSLLECVVFGRRAGKNAALFRGVEGTPTSVASLPFVAAVAVGVVTLAGWYLTRLRRRVANAAAASPPSRPQKAST